MTSIREYIKRLFSPVGSDDRGYWITVRCMKCGELVRARIDLNNELSLIDDSQANQAVYYCRKVLVGGQRCYQPVEVELFFDSNRKLLERIIKGGEFIEE